MPTSTDPPKEPPVNLVTKLKMLAKLNSAVNGVEEGIKMKNTTKIIVSVYGLLAAVAALPEVQRFVASEFATHPVLLTILSALAGLASTLHVPTSPSDSSSDSTSSKAPLWIVGAALLLGLSGAPAQAQTVTADAVWIHRDGENSAASRNTVSLQLFGTPDSGWAVAYRYTVAADAYSFKQSHGLVHRDCDPTAWLAKHKSTLPGSLRFYAELGLGASTTTNYGTGFSAEADGGLRYKFGTHLEWKIVTGGVGYYHRGAYETVTSGLAYRW